MLFGVQARYNWSSLKSGTITQRVIDDYSTSNKKQLSWSQRATTKIKVREPSNPLQEDSPLRGLWRHEISKGDTLKSYSLIPVKKTLLDLSPKNLRRVYWACLWRIGIVMLYSLLLYYRYSWYLYVIKTHRKPTSSLKTPFFLPFYKSE